MLRSTTILSFPRKSFLLSLLLCLLLSKRAQTERDARERERESSIADMNDLLVTNEQVALRRENANVFLLKFAHTRVSLLSSIDINMTTTTTRRRKQKRSSSSSLHSSSSSSSAPSSSSSPSRRAMMTLLLLLFGTISDVFVVRATWPIVRYKNGTVGVKNDGGTVKVQSTDLIVDGNLSVSGSLFIQDRDLAEYEDRVSSLEASKTPTPPVCQPPGGDKLQFDGEKWTCVCVSGWWSGDSCETPPPWSMVQKLAPFPCSPACNSLGRNCVPNQKCLVGINGEELLSLSGMDIVEFKLSNASSILSNSSFSTLPASADTAYNDWSLTFVSDDYMVVGHPNIVDTGFSIGGVSISKRQSSGSWQKQYLAQGSYLRIRVGESVSLGVLGQTRVVAYTSDGGYKYSSDSGDGAFKIIMMEQSGSSTTWRSVQEIKPKGYVYTGEWSTQVKGYVKHIVMNNFTDASPGNYFMAVRVQDYTLESVYVYKNEKFGQEDSEWVLHQEEPVWTNQLTSSTNYDQSPTMLFSEMGLIILSRKGNAVTDGISSKCGAALDVYDVLTNTISRVRLPECMHDRLAVHANSNYLVVGHQARVYVFKKSSDGTFYQEDELKLTYNENMSAGLWSGVTGGYVNFGYRVYVSPTDDIYTFQPHETTFNDYDGALHRFQRTGKTSSDSVTINGKQLYQDSDGWILLLAYEHKAGENNALVSKTAPSSPTEGYSHIWLEDLGLAASDVDSVKFYCKTSAHSRVMHFSSSTDWVKNAIVTGTYTGNQVSYWTSGTTKFDDHTANLPDATDWRCTNDLFAIPFLLCRDLSLGIVRLQGQYRWECDDFAWNSADTLHQIWFKRKSSSGA